MDCCDGSPKMATKITTTNKPGESATLSNANQPAKAPNHMSALKTAMVMGPSAKTESTCEVVTTEVRAEHADNSRTLESANSKNVVNSTTITITSKTISELKNEGKEQVEKSMDLKGVKPVVRPPTVAQEPGIVNSTGKPVLPTVAIDNLLAGMDAVRQEAIERREINHNVSGKGIGQDVSAIIGLIEQTGLSAPAAAQSAATTTTKKSPKSNNTFGPSPGKSKPGVNAVKSGPIPAGQDFGGFKATPNPNKTQRTSRTGVGSGRVASAKVNATSSAKTLAEAGQTDAGKIGKTRSEVPLRPSSSLYRPTTASTSKGPTAPSTKLKTTKSYSAVKAKMDEAAAAAGDSTDTPESQDPSLKNQFAAFSRFGDKTSDGKEISLTNSDKWMKQARVIDGRKVTTADTSIFFKKQFKTAKKINYDEFKKYIEDLASLKMIEPKEIEDKLINCGRPGLSSTTKAAHAGVVDKLKDTGSQKERIDGAGNGRRDVKITPVKTKLADKSEGITTQTLVLNTK